MREFPPEMRHAVNAVIERLTAGGATFEPHDAAELIRLVPVENPPMFAASVGWTLPGAAASGVAAGVGDVSVEGERRQARTGSAQRGHPVGGYRVRHRPGLIQVELARGRAGPADGDAFRLRYDPVTRRAGRMDLSYRQTWTVPATGWTFELRRWRSWKTPRTRGVAQLYGLPPR